MTQLQSGQINTGNNTPSGQNMKVAVDNPYITKDDYIGSFEAEGLGINANTPQYSNGQLDLMILRASSWINRYCARWFDTQTIDETKTGFTVRPYNPQLTTVVLKNRPYSKINSIYIQVLKWFIQVDVSKTGYLQDFYDKGLYKIVPMLSTAGTGAGSPIPAAIIDHVPLGVLWTNYTFGYGTVLTNQALAIITGTKQYQAPLGNRLWAPDQTINVYDTGVILSATDYTIDCPNGIVTLASAYTPNGAVTADFTTNESVPQDIKEACVLLVSHMIGQAKQNPVGATSMGIQTFNISFGEKSEVKKRVEELLDPYSHSMPIFMGL
jgi:hypothetical protein